MSACINATAGNCPRSFACITYSHSLPYENNQHVPWLDMLSKYASGIILGTYTFCNTDVLQTGTWEFPCPVDAT